MTTKFTRDELKKILTEGEAIVSFIKKDGDRRDMKCTLKGVPAYEKKTDRVKPVNDAILPVWDVNKKEWRSFAIASVVAVTKE